MLLTASDICEDEEREFTKISSLFQILRKPLRHIPIDFMSEWDIFRRTHCDSFWEETSRLSARSLHKRL